MSRITLTKVDRAFGKVGVLHDINLDIRDGELIVFVGPSGCGKSTLLRLIAGLDRPTSGTIAIDGRDVTRVAAADRGLAMVFQSYALYPHMSVRQNLAFGLENARMERAEIDRRIEEAARMLEIAPYLDRRPGQLSGGQRQRVAIGRAIVRNPTAFLLDEPLSNLDAELRISTRAELAALHERLGATMIYVTHDQIEAMTLADRIVVLRAGRIEQVGAPLELYNRPANLFVAGFIGAPRMNLLPARIYTIESRSPEHRAGRFLRHRGRGRHRRRGRRRDGRAAAPSHRPCRGRSGRRRCARRARRGTGFGDDRPYPAAGRPGDAGCADRAAAACFGR